MVMGAIMGAGIGSVTSRRYRDIRDSSRVRGPVNARAEIFSPGPVRPRAGSQKTLFPLAVGRKGLWPRGQQEYRIGSGNLRQTPADRRGFSSASLKGPRNAGIPRSAVA